MTNRTVISSIIAVALPIALVLIVVLLRARPAALFSPAARITPSGQALTTPELMPAESDGQVAAAAPTLAAARLEGPPAPELNGGGAWINSAPLTLAGLRQQGKVVLIDFWTYGCYNCTNTLPYVKQWWEKYKDQGLVIVGVHTPEFDSKRILENVQAAVKRQEIGWPIVQDNDYMIWRSYGNRYWPRFYLVDSRGQIIYDHIGEGAYEETERQIQAALAAAKGE
ncbi:MAG TPA: redoxin domain-containing protein [Roseiflexaceae bacterium]|nr:redoxin domain-containing protein [Roseiflexaceae bacterium]